jgi:hypothetical protein
MYIREENNLRARYRALPYANLYTELNLKRLNNPNRQQEYWLPYITLL